MRVDVSYKLVPPPRLAARSSAPQLQSFEIAGALLVLTPFSKSDVNGVTVTPYRRAHGPAGCGGAGGSSWVGELWGVDGCQLG